MKIPSTFGENRKRMQRLEDVAIRLHGLVIMGVVLHNVDGELAVCLTHYGENSPAVLAKLLRQLADRVETEPEVM